MPDHATPVTDRQACQFLDVLERDEARLLTWGVVDGGFTEDDLLERAERYLAEDEEGEGLAPSDLVADMLRRHLVVDLPADGGRIYRTRMAESVRLFARLRQMFEFRQWRTGATLVSDFRFALRPRVYPRREVSTMQAMEHWEGAGVLNPARRSALAALLDRPDFRLAGFQVRATDRVLRDLDGSWSRGMIVTVGTGSGKTLAFYLPALAHIASLIGSGSGWTKAVAMYPRNELLKDQFSDTYAEVRRLDAALDAQGRRRLTIGAYFGPTPRNATASEMRGKNWEETATGYVCPFLRCPSCRGDLVWRMQHLTRRHEQLDCGGCGTTVSGDDVYLTRQRMQASPPDVLFTTTEMLNRVIGDTSTRHVFGLGVPTPPQMVLLDEVHTYVGTHGAQVALLLRRWRHAAGGRMQFTGLSATLRNATEFFAQLTGLPEHAVEEVTPTQGELESEGMEYMLVLRGDPVSKTSLLSTTIQAAILLRRVMDPRRGTVAGTVEGMYGQKVFAFTDDLDVTNRLYHNLLDAEGVDYRNVPRPGRAPLASLRARGWPDNPQRLRAGQSWFLCEEIGHPEGLAAPLRIGRTSSQDTGVNRQADVVVATASLEVGYNDPDVGAVLQHKAPRDAAAFVQRKGRAGRLRQMRPWTVVVLSDYGRDRIAYQGYESLFDPLLPPRVLPVANRYVLRIQAVYAFMDWLAQQLGGLPSGSVYRDLAGPTTWAPAVARQRAEAAIVRRLLSGDPPLQASLERYLARALGVSAEEVTALAWDPPRSLMLQALPTLLRRLESGWSRVPLRPGESTRDALAENSPLPDFVPPNLFSDLNLPEVTVVSSIRGDGRSPREDSLPINQALRTLVPGKVTRRFAVNHPGISHWIPLPSLEPTATQQELAVEGMCEEYEELGHFQTLTDGAPVDVRCVRPRVMRPAIVPQLVNATSNAWPEWRSQLIPGGTGVVLDLPSGSPWSSHVHEVRLHAHAYRASVEVRRFAIGARASVRLRRAHANEWEGEVRYVEHDSRRPAALGSTAHVDGIRFRVHLPIEDVLRPDDANVAKVRAFRTAYFRHRVLTDEILGAHTNSFQREWLCQVYLSALTAWAISDSPSLRQASEAMGPFLAIAAEKVLRVIFEALATDEGDEEIGDERKRGLKEDVLDLLGQSAIADRMRDLAEVLWAPPDAGWHRLAGQRYLATLGGALLEACRQLYPEAGTDDLVLDIDPGARPPGVESSPADMAELWITETAIGGGGVIEEIGRRYVEDPRRYFCLVEGALGPSDRELSGGELTRVLELAETDGEVADALRRVRSAPRHDDLQAAIGQLEAVLAARGVVVNRAVMSAVHARITRPGSSADTDQLLLGLLRRWHAYEERLGIEVDARVFAYLESEREEVVHALAQVDPEAAKDRAFRFHAISGLLWPRGNLIRALALATYNPFAALPDADRELVLDHVGARAPAVSVRELAWRARVTEALRAHGAVLLTASPEDRSVLRTALLTLAVEPLESDYLHVFPRVDGVARGTNGFTAAIVLTEAVQ